MLIYFLFTGESSERSTPKKSARVQDEERKDGAFELEMSGEFK